MASEGGVPPDDRVSSEYRARLEAMASLQAKLRERLRETASTLDAQVKEQEAGLAPRLAVLRRTAAAQQGIKVELDSVYSRLRAIRKRLEDKHPWAIAEAERMVDAEERARREGAGEGSTGRDGGGPEGDSGSGPGGSGSGRHDVDVEAWLRGARWSR